MSPPLRKLFRPEVLAEKAYHLDSYPELIKLNQNELPYDLPPNLKTELFRRLKEVALHRYPLPQPVRLKKAMAKRLRVDPKQLQFSNGSNVMIQAIISAAAGRGKVLTLDPTFSVYEIEAQLLGNRAIRVPLNREDFSLPLEKFLRTMRKERPRVIFVANPNAPTGNLFDEDALLEIARKAKCLTVFDEAYFQFSGKTLLPRLKKLPHVALLRTFSKGFGLGGVRIGYLIARPDVSEQVQKLLLPYCLSVLSEETALFVLEKQDYFDGIIAATLKERDRLLAGMGTIEGIQVFPSDANFILFRTRDANACFAHLVKNGILVRNVSNKHSLKNCLRVSVGQPKENDVFLSALRKFR